MPTSAQDPRYRRDLAQWRTRRLSWLVAGGAATASVALGVAFSQLLPGHSAAATAPSGGQGQAGQGGGQGSGSAGGGSQPAQSQPGQSQPTSAPPPAPAPAPAQAVSGGS